MIKMLRVIVSCVCLVMILQPAKAQSPQFNHTTIFVVDMNKSADFYEKVMMLQRIPEPFHDNKHIWEKIGEHSQLHIVQGAKEVMPHEIEIHLAFTVPSVENFAKHLDALNIKYGNYAQTSKEPQVRNDGIKQIYLQDPDGYWIEVNDDKF
ncbi:MAG TPA: VOC family protein [Chitinophagaceae bacterium]|nr:VOC family protein [Chitinophagaceae bacterium]